MRRLGALARQRAGNSAGDGVVVLAEMGKGSGAWEFDAGRNIYTDLLNADKTERQGLETYV